ncbi:MAG: pseudouridine-5'-phosphate glycosidase [Anaerolineales bacterium]|nr:pseudouridine-5'-phosphate glycosidase [Anaerolineales bacterium]
MENLPHFRLREEVQNALAQGKPVVALESTVISHGLPPPKNLELAGEMEAVVRSGGAVPATIALLDGCIRVGLAPDELRTLAGVNGMRKISVRDFGPGIQAGASGGTTVAATIFAASKVGIQVMATGGIGGVHRSPPNDVSADLPQLARTPMVVVCAGAKAILDLDATLEYLETWGVPVVGYRTGEFPAFYSAASGLRLTVKAETPQEAAQIASSHWEVGNSSAVLVVAPPPAESAMPADEMWGAVGRALEDADQAGVRGQEVTPFLLDRVSQITGGSSLAANLALLKNNAKIASKIAVEMARQ